MQSLTFANLDINIHALSDILVVFETKDIVDKFKCQ